MLRRKLRRATDTASQARPEATASTAGAPKGSKSAASAASRTPIPAWVMGTAADNFANGHAKSHMRNG